MRLPTFLCLTAVTALMVSACGGRAEPQIAGSPPLPPLRAVPEGSLAVWDAGAGTIAGARASRGDALLAEVWAVADESGPVRLQLSKIPGSRLILAADAAIHLQEVDGDSGTELIMHIERGAIQLDTPTHGPYQRVLVRGAALELELLGTLINAERVSPTQDFVLLLHGRIKVRLQQAVAKALELLEQQEVELGPRETLIADSQQGLGKISLASERPQLSGSKSQRTSLQEQAAPTPLPEAGGTGVPELGGEVEQGSWGQDLAGLQLDEELLDVVSEPGLFEPEGFAVDDFTEDLSSSLEAEFSDAVFSDTIQQEVIDQISEELVPRAPLGEFPAPPEQ